MRQAQMGKELRITGENRVGFLSDVAEILAQQGISILAVAVQVADAEAWVRIVTDAPSYALDALRAADFSVDERDVVLVELPHRPGLLRRITEALARADIDIHDLYATASAESARSLVVLSCSHNNKALLLLRDR